MVLHVDTVDTWCPFKTLGVKQQKNRSDVFACQTSNCSPPCYSKSTQTYFFPQIAEVLLFTFDLVFLWFEKDIFY